MAAQRRWSCFLLAVLAFSACADDGEPTASTRETTTTATPAVDDAAVDQETAPTSSEEEVVLRTDGLGPLRLGMTAADAEKTGLIGSVGPGCELGGTEAAKLQAPLVGTVNFSEGKLESIDLRAGASTEEDVAPTATVEEITEAYDGENGFTLKRIDETEEQYGFFMLEASKGGKKYSFIVEVDEVRASSVAVPDPLFCE
jgi:hypothetical protein